jgi:dipeptidyl aminopeptidase/acylaminoacyl peptidase
MRRADWRDGGDKKLSAKTFLLAASVLAMAPSGVFAAQRTLADDARDFGARHAPRAMALSPDGTKIVYLMPKTGQSIAARVTELATQATREIVVADGKPEMLRWCEFATNTRVVCNYSGLDRFQGQILGFSRLISLNSDGSDLKELGEPSTLSSGRLVQFDGSVIDWNKGNSVNVLMARVHRPKVGSISRGASRRSEGLAVDMVDVETAKAEQVEAPRDNVSNYISDGGGHVRFMQVNETSDGNLLTGKIKQFYRRPGKSEWLSFGDFDSVADTGFLPIAVDGSADVVYGLKKKDGRDALYRVKLDGSMTSELVAANPKVDIDGIIRLGRGQSIAGYSFTDDRSHHEYFDPQIRALVTSLAKAAPDLPLLTISDVSADGTKVLVFASSDSDPGRYFLVDRKTHQAKEIAIARPELVGRDFAQVREVEYPGKDGVMVPAYVTLPPGSAGRNLAAVVLPHGGPSSRDEWGFDWIAQFLAARGYAVIQPNYRGSAGYGTEWLADNGLKNWQLAMSDISAAAHYLVNQKIADPNRLAIVGWSYGGYAALQSIELEPTLYKAAVAIAPVTDLGLLKQNSRNYTSSSIVEEFVGSGAHVADGSPLRNVAAIRVPVLLVHGDLDANVNIGHSDQMAAALRKAGKQFDYLRYKGLDHQLEDSAVRAEMLTRIDQLLTRTLGSTN